MTKQAETEPQATARRLEQLLGLSKFPTSLGYLTSDLTSSDKVEVAVLYRIGTAKYSKEDGEEFLTFSADYRLTPQSRLGLDDIACSLKKNLESCLKQYGQVRFTEKTNIDVKTESLESQYDLDINKLLDFSKNSRSVAGTEIGTYMSFFLKKTKGENGELSIALNMPKEKARQVLSSFDVGYNE